MASESDIIGRESGGNPYIGFSGVDLSNAPLNKYGFPIWSGAMGPAGISHAAGLYQFEPKTWEEGASALGITDFSPTSQKKVYDYTREKYGEAPWAASAPLKPGEHRWVGAPSGGGGQPLYLGTLEKNFHDTGNSLLDALLAQNYPKEDKPTGNGLLDQIMQQAVFGLGPPNQAQPAPDAAKALWQPPLALPPQTVPELSGQQVDIKSMQPLQQAAMPMPGSQSQEYGREGLTPPNVRGPEPTPPPIPIPGSQDHNRFFTPNEVAPYNPPGVPDDRMQQAATGNGLLDRILKQLSPIASAQAAEPPTAPQPPPATTVAPPPVTPAPAPPQTPPAVPPQQFIEPPAKGQVVPPAVQPRAAQAPAPPAPTQPPIRVGRGLLDTLLTQSAGQLANTFLGQPLQAGMRGISGQDQPGTPAAIEDAMAGAQLASAGSIGRGGMGAGPRLPERIEPPPMRFTEAAREAPSEPLAPGHTGQQLVVARRMPSGEIRYGQPGQTHADLIDPDEMLKSGEPWFPPPDQTMGFAQPGGPFMSRDEALAFVRRNEPARAVTAHEPTGLQAEQYQREAPSGPLAPKQPEISPPATPPGAPEVIGREDFIRPFTDASGATDLAAAANALTTKVQAALAAGRKVTLFADGKPIPITAVDRGMMADAQGQRWGTLALATDKGGGNRVEISGGQQPAPAPAPPAPPSEAAQPPIRPPPPGETPPPAPLTPPPGGNGPVITPPTLPDKKKLKVTRQKVQDDLNWTVRSRYADAIEAKQFVNSLPAEFQDPNFRAGVGRDIERRLADPTIDLKPATRTFLDLPQVKKLTDEEHALGLELRKLLTPGQADQLGVESGYRTVEEGHVHRMVEGRQLQGEILPDVDPITGRPRGLGGRSLSRNASGMKRRSDHFVGQDDQGNRVWSKRSLSETMPAVPRGYTRFYSDGQGGWTPDRDVIRQRHPTGSTTLYTDFPTTQAGQFRVGDTYNLPDARRNAKLAPPEKYGDRYQVGHNTYTAREPTMTEMEANLPIRYRNDYLLGLVNNVNRMRAVVRNLHVIDDLKGKLQGEGLWVPRAEKYLHSPPIGTDARGQPVRFERVNLPQLDGWAHPRIANTINDFAKGFEDQNLLEKVNNVLIGSMFILPFGHIRNVGAHYVIGRGLDWAYRNPQLLRSFNEVWNLGPIYQRFIRENGPAMYPGAADVHGKLVEKLLHDMANDEGWEITAKALGTSMAKLLPAMYNWSARSLWFTNDHLFLARTLENLKRAGHVDPMAAPSQAWQQAIAHTKREIPPYEIPDQILKSRGLQRLLTSPVFAFGRYTYDKYRILGENVKEMMGHYGKGMPQVEGAAKALLTLMLAFPVTSALNAALQQATGNKNARVYGAGPTTIARTVGTGLGRLAGVDPKSALGWTLGMTPGEADFSHALSGILTFSPALDMVVKLFGGGHDPYTGQSMIGQHATPMGRTAQGLEALIGAFYPGEIALKALREGPGALAEPLGVDLAGPRQPSGKGIRMQRGLEHGREKRDPFQQLLRRGVGAVERAVQ